MVINIRVYGLPATAGSKRGFLNKVTGKIIMAEAGERQKPWMEAVKFAAIQAGYNGKLLLEKAIRLEVVFLFHRPKGHYNNKGELKKSARAHHTVKPDRTKLLRAVEDALTGLIWWDDSQVVCGPTTKRYCETGEAQGAKITITEL